MSDLRARIEEHLARATGSTAVVRKLTPLAGGACQDNVRVDLTLDGQETTLVLRSDARGSLPGSLDRKAELLVVEAAALANVKTPRGRFLAKDLARPNTYAYFLDWVDGEALGRRVVSHPSLEKAREELPEQLVAELAKIHAAHPDMGPRPKDPVTTSLALVRQLVGRLPQPRPALELALAWLEDHPPEDREVTLVHGDFRTGNFLVTPRGLSAVLDWEFAHWGSPLEDLAWLCLRDWRFGRLDRAAGGLFPRAQLYDLYRRFTKRATREADVRYWEVFGNVRWAAGSLFQGERAITGGEGDLELLAIARRASEMEFEALRLIEAAS